MQHYRSADWKAFRDEVIRLDGGVCVRCGRGRVVGVVLQVHHKRYLPGKKPWEYPYELCETLCRGCHAQEHGLIVPRRDWEAVGVDDLGDLSGECDLCGTSIRHVFLIEHRKWPAMEVGEICCDRLTCTDEATEYMDELRLAKERRKRFVSSSRWQNSSEGHLSIRQKGIAVTVVIHDTHHFRLTMDGRLGNTVYESILDAKMKAFDSIESGSVRSYLERITRPRS